MMTDQILLACPNCGKDVDNIDAECRCAACGVVGHEIDRILCFNDPSYYWGEVSQVEMRRINELAAELGWCSAVKEAVADSELQDYICSDKRADFRHVWDVPRSATVLDVGAGWGAIASALGQHFARVVAVEGVLERCRFIRTRTHQMNLPNVTTICADFLRLPLRSEQFDVVVLNGVLEWSAIARQGECRELQLNFLRRVRDLLKPSGFLCVGIENRIGLSMLRGEVDHSGMPYTSLMPRKIADMLCRLKPKQFRSSTNTGYRTYTYSLAGYRKLFRDAGFRSTQAFHAWAGYNAPSLLLPLGKTAPLLHFLRQQHLERRGVRGRLQNVVLAIAARTGLWAHMASEYIFLVSKS